MLEYEFSNRPVERGADGKIRIYPYRIKKQIEWHEAEARKLRKILQAAIELDGA
jgi:hypothetical protein